MKIVISKTVSRTYSLGNYENYKPSFTITIEDEIEKWEWVDFAKKFENIGKLLDDELAKEKQKITKDENKTIDELFPS